MCHLFIITGLLCLFNFNQQDSISSKDDDPVITESPRDNSSGSLVVDLEIKNKSPKINDGKVIVHAAGGIPPYHFYWSKKIIPGASNIASNLTEGKNYKLTVSDKSGNHVSFNVEVPPESADEYINSFFVPIVEFIETIIMADLFALANLYNPQVFDNNNIRQFHKNGDPLIIGIPFVVVWIILGGLFFTFKMNFINLRGISHAIALIKGKYDKPSDKGEVSHFQALATALSATVGLGNIAGVAIAITIGGPGATFWMIIAGFLGMSLKFTECTLGVKYREIDDEGNVSGGPMYYLSKGLEKRNLKLFGKILAGIFAFVVIGASFGGGNMFQANQAFSQVSDIIPSLQNSGTLFGIFLAVFVGAVIIGGIRSIARVTEKIVPLMAILYILTAIIIIVMHIDYAGQAFSLIIEGAFSPGALKGGIIGVLITGFQRASFSNEAGVGSAPIAHSAVKTEEPVSEGIVSLLEPFIDTVIICTMTALVIIFSGFHENPGGLSGVEITSAAFETVFPWFKYILAIAILLFAFSTMISWSYYGLKGFNYLFGNIFQNKRISPKLPVSSLIYYIVFLTFIVVGSASSLGAVIDFSDMMILTMAFPNIFGLLIMSSEVKKDLKDYFRRLKSGAIRKYK